MEKKLREHEKKERKTNSLTAATTVTNPAASLSITNRASTHQSRPLYSTDATNSTNSTVLTSSSPNSNSTYSSLAAPSSTIYSRTLSTSTHIQSRTATETNTAFVLLDSPSIPQCSPSTQRLCCNRNDNDYVRNFMEGMFWGGGIDDIEVNWRDIGKNEIGWKLDLIFILAAAQPTQEKK